MDWKKNIYWKFFSPSPLISNGPPLKRMTLKYRPLNLVPHWAYFYLYIWHNTLCASVWDLYTLGYLETTSLQHSLRKAKPEFHFLQRLLQRKCCKHVHFRVSCSRNLCRNKIAMQLVAKIAWCENEEDRQLVWVFYLFLFPKDIHVYQTNYKK